MPRLPGTKNNNKTGDKKTKWDLSEFDPWNTAQKDYWLSELTDDDEEIDDDDGIEMCKTIRCSVEAYRVNACMKAENTYVEIYKVKKFADLSEELKEKCYRYMEEKAVRLEKLLNMDRYQKGRERRRLRVQDAYLEERHQKRVYDQMKLLSVPVQDNMPNQHTSYSLEESYEVTFGSAQSSQTVIPAKPKPGAKKETEMVVAHAVANVELISSTTVERYIPYASQQRTDETVIESIAVPDSELTICSGGDYGAINAETSDDDDVNEEIRQRYNFRHNQSQQMESQTYTQFEENNVVTSTQDDQDPKH